MTPSTSTPTPAWLSTADTIAALGVSLSTLRRLEKSGMIKSRKIGTKKCFDLTAYLDGTTVDTDDNSPTAPFVAVVMDNRREVVIRGEHRGVNRPVMSYMLPAVGVPEGTYREHPIIAFQVGANLTKLHSSEPVTFDEWQQIIAQPAAKKQLSQGVLEVFYPVAPEHGTTFRSFSVEDVLHLIASTYGLEQLKSYCHPEEDRAEVLDAIADRKTEIESALAYAKGNVLSPHDARRSYR